MPQAGEDPHSPALEKLHGAHLRALSRLANLRLRFGSSLVRRPLEECSHRVSGIGVTTAPKVTGELKQPPVSSPENVGFAAAHLELQRGGGAALLTAGHSWIWKRFLQGVMEPSREASPPPLLQQHLQLAPGFPPCLKCGGCRVTVRGTVGFSLFNKQLGLS